MRNVGDSFILDCTVTGSYPSPVTLYAVVNDSVHMNIMNDPILTYTNLFTNNSGSYQCIADSGQAITTYTFNLDVRQATGNLLIFKFTFHAAYFTLS